MTPIRYSPGEEGGVAPIAVEVPPRLDERVLHGLLHVSLVGEDAEQDEAEATLVPLNDRRERVDVPLLRQSHELGIGLLAGRHPEIVRS